MNFGADLRCLFLPSFCPFPRFSLPLFPNHSNYKYSAAPLRIAHTK